MKKLLLVFLVLLLSSFKLAFEHPRELQPPVPEKQPVPSIIAPYVDDSVCMAWADSVMQTMTMRERVGQMFIYTMSPRYIKSQRTLLRKLISEYKIGGLLFSAGHILDQARMTNEGQHLSKVPLLITCDGEWGLSMRLKEAMLFPKNMALGCITDDTLIYEMGEEVARQCKELGIQVNFAPVSDVNVNPKNPVINTRSFGENPLSVGSKVVAFAHGLEAGGVLAVCKHFPGHGDTETDSHKALPVLPFSRDRLDSIELYPFRKAIHSGVSGMMVGHLYVPSLAQEDTLPASLSHKIVNELLQKELRFDGLTFTDALAMKGVSGETDVCLKAILAGNDLLLVPRKMEAELASIDKAIEDGRLSEELINEKCRKILIYKYALGLNKVRPIRLPGLLSRINTKAAKSLVRRLNDASLTVLTRQDSILPFDKSVKKVALLNVGDVRVIQPLLKEIRKHCAADVISLPKNASPAIRTRLYKQLGKYSRVVVAVHERTLKAYQKFFDGYEPQNTVVYLSYIMSHPLLQIYHGISYGAAVILANNAEDETQVQSVKALFGEVSAPGRLSASLGDVYSSGEGQDDVEVENAESAENTTPIQLSQIDQVAEHGIKEGAYPGCQVVVLKEGKEIYNKCFGTTEGKGSAAVKPDDVYDLASLSKTTGTLLAVMKLYDKGLLRLEDKASQYLPFLQGTDKENITIRELLFHESGLPSTILFYQNAIDKNSLKGKKLFSSAKDAAHSVCVAANTWAYPDFKYVEGLTSSVKTADYTMQVCDNLWLHRSWKQDFLKQIATARLGSKTYRYSCVGFITLQQVVEAITHTSMDRFLQKEFYQPMGLKRTGYLPLRFLKKEQIVPTMNDRFLRKVKLQGFVHDESAAFLGGISGNAGLFSTALEVAKIYQMVLNGGTYQGKHYLSKETCELFTTTVSPKSRRGLGFDKPDARNPKNSPCSSNTPASVYGHTGFTGTCAWVDPDNKLVYVFLCNRLYSDSVVNRLSKLGIRKEIQSIIYKNIHAN